MLSHIGKERNTANHGVIKLIQIVEPHVLCSSRGDPFTGDAVFPSERRDVFASSLLAKEGAIKRLLAVTP